MRNLSTLLIAIFFVLVQWSCNADTQKYSGLADMSEKQASLKTEENLSQPAPSPEELTKSFQRFWEYYSSEVKLYKSFLAVDENGKEITKDEFLVSMQTGKYFPLALNSAEENLKYQLVRIPKDADAFIGNYMRQFGSEQLKFHRMVGKPLPKFNFYDLNGKQYSSENTKGKMLLIKCWFISCVPCVAEMPALNRMVEKYQDRDDILFLSLAIDRPDALKAFHQKKVFKYQTVGNQRDYMEQQLNVTAYPTHFMVSKDGNLAAVLPDEHTVLEALERELQK